MQPFEIIKMPKTSHWNAIFNISFFLFDIRVIMPKF